MSNTEGVKNDTTTISAHQKLSIVPDSSVPSMKLSLPKDEARKYLYCWKKIPGQCGNNFLTDLAANSACRSGTRRPPVPAIWQGLRTSWITRAGPSAMCARPMDGQYVIRLFGQYFIRPGRQFVITTEESKLYERTDELVIWMNRHKIIWTDRQYVVWMIG